MSRSAGVGVPNRFKCTPCRSTLNNRTGLKWEATGRRKPLSNGGKNSSGRVDPAYVYEYRCDECYFVGWSRHMDVAQAWKLFTERRAIATAGGAQHREFREK